MSNPTPHTPKLRIQILDGGLGTSLEDHYGQKFTSTTSPLWSSSLLVSDPSMLERCQADFVTAGADVLLTATYQISQEGFARTRTSEFPDGLSGRGDMKRFLRRAVDIAVGAVRKGGGHVTTFSERDGDYARSVGIVDEMNFERGVKIALSLGPFGAALIPGAEYSGLYPDSHNSEDALYQWHLDRLRLFYETPGLFDKISYVAFETLPRLDEIRAVRRAMKALAPGKPRFWISMVFPNDQPKLPDQSSVAAVVHAALGDSKDGEMPWGIGINCTKMHRLGPILQEMGDAVGQLVEKRGGFRPALVLYPDGTDEEVYDVQTQTWVKEGFEAEALKSGEKASWATQLADTIRKEVKRGIFSEYLVGGCCKANADAIKGLREELRPNPLSAVNR